MIGHIAAIRRASVPGAVIAVQIVLGAPVIRAGVVVRASIHQALFRLLSWQSLLAALVNAPELAYLIDGLEEKYGLKPD